MPRAATARDAGERGPLGVANSFRQRQLCVRDQFSRAAFTDGAPLAPRRGVIWRAAERVMWAVALLTLTTWAVFRLDGAVASQEQLDRFVEARDGKLVARSQPDFALWSPHAIAAWRSASATGLPPPLGVLRVPRLGLEAPILEGTDDATLNHAIGHIEGTPQPGEPGNSAMAGHRDSFFRALKDIAIGDTLEVETLAGRRSYTVERTWIVRPEDVWVLDPTPSEAVTLVTCYPFYFVGSAPKRFIVRATKRGDL
jgi:sortase A